jgi:hypothetical protein
MRSRKSYWGILAALFLLLTCGTAGAQATRTWVSGVGDDANPCSRTAPCKTFAGAISKTTAGGEIDALDPGGFGAVTITKAIVIDGHAALGGVLVSGTDGITVSAGANDVVILRGLTFSGIASGLSGINFTSGLALHVEDTTISGFTTAAITFKPAAAATLFLKHVTASNNANGVVVGTGQAVISKSHFFNDGVGLYATGSAKVSVQDSVFAGNAQYGVHCDMTASVNIDRGLIVANGVGVQGDSLVRLSDVMIGHNTTGLAGMNVTSFGNNRVAAGNGTNGAPNNTLPQQ